MAKYSSSKTGEKKDNDWAVYAASLLEELLKKGGGE